MAGGGRVKVDGHWFLSAREVEVYLSLKKLEQDGRLKDLIVSPEYDLIVNGALISKFHPTFRFQDSYKPGQHIRFVKVLQIESPMMLLKRKLFEALYLEKLEIWK